jgi:hypothetical protein
MRARLLGLWARVRGPLAWMAAGAVLMLAGYGSWSAYGHRHDHSNLHALSQWAPKAQAEIDALQKAIQK